MRIAFVTEMWKPLANGVVTRLSATIDELTGLGHEVLVVAPSLGPADATVEPQPGVTERRVPSYRVPWIYGGQAWGWPAPRVRRFLADFRPDIVHAVSPFSLGVAGVLGARQLRLPLITSFHTDIAAYSTSYHMGWLRPATWEIIRSLHNAGRMTLVTSRHSEELLGRHGIRHIVLWRRGVNLAQFAAADPAVPPAITPYEPDPDRPTVLYVGRLADEKGLDRLLPLARSGQVHLVLVGAGPARARLEREFAGTGTTFTGEVRGPALTQAYAGADVFAFTSTTDTLGLVLLEALASGLPVVAVESPASRELLAELPVARLIDPEHPTDFVPMVAELLAWKTPAERAAIARQEAAPWTWAKATEQLIGYYQQVLSATSPA